MRTDTTAPNSRRTFLKHSIAATACCSVISSASADSQPSPVAPIPTTPVSELDRAMMNAAIEQAELSQSQMGQAFGAVLARGDEVVAAGFNSQVQNGDPTSHSEIETLRAAGSIDYTDTVLYTTAVPCPMCAGAVVITGIPKVVIGATNEGLDLDLGDIDPDMGVRMLQSAGIELVDMQSARCKQFMLDWIENFAEQSLPTS